MLSTLKNTKLSKIMVFFVSLNYVQIHNIVLLLFTSFKTIWNKTYIFKPWIGHYRGPGISPTFQCDIFPFWPRYNSARVFVCQMNGYGWRIYFFVIKIRKWKQEKKQEKRNFSVFIFVFSIYLMLCMVSSIHIFSKFYREWISFWINRNKLRWSG